MKPFVTFVLTFASLSLSAAEFHPSEGPKPLAVLIQTDPWAMVIGADRPRVAIYEDGTIIYLKKLDEGAKYCYVKLPEEELSNLREHLTMLIGTNNWKTFYNLCPNITDQPESLFYVRDGDRELVTRVYGLKAEETKLPGYTVLRGDHKPDNLPDELFSLHKYLCSVEYPDSREWIPKYVEVIIWPYGNFFAASINWPKDWPALNSERAVKSGASYSIYLDGKVLPELQKFMRLQKDRAVKIGGKKWAMSVRYVFPSQPIWDKMFSDVKNK